jgi:hypothetical protein
MPGQLLGDAGTDQCRPIAGERQQMGVVAGHAERLGLLPVDVPDGELAPIVLDAEQLPVGRKGEPLDRALGAEAANLLARRHLRQADGSVHRP